MERSALTKPSSLVLALALAISVGGLPAPAAAQVQYTIQGRVTDNQSLTPLNGASIQIVSGNRVIGMTGTRPNGTYSIGMGITGDHRVITSFSGYVADTSRVTFGGSETTIIHNVRLAPVAGGPTPGS